MKAHASETSDNHTMSTWFPAMVRSRKREQAGCTRASCKQACLKLCCNRGASDTMYFMDFTHFMLLMYLLQGAYDIMGFMHFMLLMTCTRYHEAHTLT